MKRVICCSSSAAPHHTRYSLLRSIIQKLILSSVIVLLITVIFWQISIRCVNLDFTLLEPHHVSSLDIFDTNGVRLRQEINDSGYRETWVSLQSVSPHLIHATLASEDHQFYGHQGVDWSALFRATWLNFKAQRFAFGGSTLTMQLVRLIDQTPRDLFGKLRQMRLAAHLELKRSKEQILEQYLNRVYYGNGSWGVEQAAQLYFSKSADHLSIAEAATLVVIPRGPSYYNPFKHWRRLIKRRDQILGLMVQRGYITVDEQALAQRAQLKLHLSKKHFRAPHFVQFVKGRLPSYFKTGTQVESTLDWSLQESLEVAVKRHINRLYWRNLTQASLVVIRNMDGAILAMVGSKDYNDYQENGAFNGVTAHLRPGSTLKPFVYGAAFELGDTPASIALDVILPHEINEFYTKDVRSHGFARYREALAGSYNLSAVHTLQRVGVEYVLNKLRKAGIWTLSRPDQDYDWGLAIGHAQVRLLELTAAFSVFSRGGHSVVPYAIQQATHINGDIFQEPIRRQHSIFSPQIAYLIFDILSDPDARRPMFGDSVPLNLPFKIALKTGTTRAYTDVWAIGTTREYTVGVWAGNFKGEPTHQVKSVQGATPLLRDAYTVIAARFGDPTAPERPLGIVEMSICPLSGKLRGPHCPHEKQELFMEEHLPQERCDWHRLQCGKTPIVVYPKEVRSWTSFFQSNPTQSCKKQPQRVEEIHIVQPISGAKFVLEPHRPLTAQRPPLRISPDHIEAKWTVNGAPIDSWIPTPGVHLIKATWGTLSDEVAINYR